MKPENRELLRDSLIRWLVQDAARFGKPARLLLAHARSEAWPHLTVDELVAELDYLADATNGLGKALVQAVAKLSPEETRWKPTAAGRDYAAERHLE